MKVEPSPLFTTMRTITPNNYSQAIHSPDIVGPCSNAACKATVEALKNECTQLRAEVYSL